jgi:hypothetical protein
LHPTDQSEVVHHRSDDRPEVEMIVGDVNRQQTVLVEPGQVQFDGFTRQQVDRNRV